MSDGSKERFIDDFVQRVALSVEQKTGESMDTTCPTVFTTILSEVAAEVYRLERTLDRASKCGCGDET